MLKNCAINYFRILFYLASGLLFANDLSTFKYYDIDDKKTQFIIDEIDINFKKLDLDFNENDTLYLRLTPISPNDADIRWPKQSAGLSVLSKLKQRLFLNSDWKNIKLGATSKKKFTDPVNIGKTLNVLAVPIKGGNKNGEKDSWFSRLRSFARIPDKRRVTINKNDWLTLNRVHFTYQGHGAIRIEASSRKKEWKPIGCEFRIAKKETIALDKKYLFLKKNEADAFMLTFTINLDEFSFLNKSYGFQFVLSNISGADAIWDFTESITLPSKKTLQYVSSDIIEWFPEQTISGNTSITFDDLPIRNQTGDGQIELNVRAIVSDSNGKKNTDTTLIEVGNIKNPIRWEEFNVSLNSKNDDFIFYREGSNPSNIRLKIDGEAIKHFGENESFILHINNTDVIFLLKNFDEEGLTGFNHELSENKRDIIFTRNRVRLGNNIPIIEKLAFKLHQDISTSINLSWSSNVFAQNERMTVKHKILLGKPSLQLLNDTYVYNTDYLPILSPLILTEDAQLSFLKKGDKVIYTIQQNAIKFASNRLSQIEISPKVLKASIPSEDESSIHFELNKALEPGQSVTINNIPIKSVGSESNLNRVHGAFSIQSKRLALIEINNIDDPKAIIISNVRFTVAKSKEFLKNVNKNTNNFTFPSIEILNKGDFGVFKNSKLQIRLKTEQKYSFNINSTDFNIPNGLKIEGESLSEDRRSVNITLSGELPSGAKLRIKNLKLKMANEDRNFYEKSLVLQVEANNHIIEWETENTFTFGSPTMSSLLEQVIYPPQSNEYYLFEIDLSKFPLTLAKSHSLTLAIPESIDLAWSPQSQLRFEGKGNKYFKPKYELSKGGKWMTIYFDESLKDSPELAKVYIGGCQYPKKIKTYDTPKSLAIQLSLNNGHTFIAEDGTPKWIVSPKNKAYIARQKVKEAYYPFQKGNKISFKIMANKKWDKEKTLIQVRNKLLGTAFDFKNPAYLSQDKILTFGILKDKYSTHKEDKKKDYKMDFGKKILLITMVTKAKEEDIFLLLTTPYGQKEYKRSEGMVIFRPENMPNGTTEITIGLKNFKEGKLTQDNVRSWYWRPELFLDYLNISGDTQLENNSLKDKVRLMRDELEEIKRDLGNDTEYDWAYWYYLSWLKKRVKELNLRNFTSNSLPMEKSYIKDMEQAKLSGYHKGMNSIFPSSGDSVGVASARKEDFKKALTLVEKEDYLGAEDIILDALLKEGIEENYYIKAAFYGLLGKIGAKLNDEKIIYIGRRSKEKMTYPKFVCKRAEDLLSDPTDKQNLKNWQEDIYRFIMNFEEQINALNKLHSKSEYLEPQKDTRKERGVEPSTKVLLSWHPNQVAKTFNWEAKVRTPKIFFNKKENQEMLYIDKYNYKKEKIPFGEQLELYGGGIYTIEFSPKRELAKHFGISTLAGVLIYAWFQ